MQRQTGYGRPALKTGQGLRILDHLVGKKLKRDKPVQCQVFGFVHHTHPAAAELFEDAIVRDGLADHDANLTSEILASQ